MKGKKNATTRPSTDKSAWSRGVEAQEMNAKMGSKIRNYREQKGISLNTASELTGLPAATLSRIETNKMSPTFPVLVKMMTGLKLSWADLMGPSRAIDPTNQISISMPGETPSNTIQGYTHWAPHSENHLSHIAQPLVFEISAKSLNEAGGLKGHDGVEFCYVLKGTLSLHFEGREPADIPEGGSAMFLGQIPHSYVSKGRKKTQVLNLVMADPILSSDEPKEPFGLRYAE